MDTLYWLAVVIVGIGLVPLVIGLREGTGGNKARTAGALVILIGVGVALVKWLLV